MPSVTTQAIVLRHADYREHDRMLTLLSPSMGRVEALCRGCKRPQSPLLAASEWFALGEYVLYAGKGRMTVTSCSLTESFFPLRADWDKLKYATYLLSIAEAAAEVNSLFHAAQRAADMYLLNVQRICAEKAETAGQAERWAECLKDMQPLSGEEEKTTGTEPEPPEPETDGTSLPEEGSCKG